MKSPSFWLRDVDVTYKFAHVGDRVVPVEMISTGRVRMFGRSNFRMVYDYESIDGRPADAQGVAGRRTVAARRRLRTRPDVLGARTLRALALFESHLLTFTQLVEPSALNRRIVEEVFGAVVRRNEPEALVADDALDRS